MARPTLGQPVLAQHPRCVELSHVGCNLVRSFENLSGPFSHVAKAEDNGRDRSSWPTESGEMPPTIRQQGGLLPGILTVPQVFG